MNDEKTKPVNVPLFGLTLNLSFRDKDEADASEHARAPMQYYYFGQKENQPASKAILLSHFHCVWYVRTYVRTFAIAAPSFIINNFTFLVVNLFGGREMEIRRGL